MNKKLKPNKTSYFYFNFAISVLVYLVITAILYILGQFINFPVFLLPVLFLLVVLFSYINQKIKYKKKEYIFEENRIIEKGGGIFSDYETELVIQNITHVDLKLPFIKNNLLSTGFIRIESAGGGGTELHLKDLDKPNETYEYIKKAMVDNGFDLGTDDLVQNEKPESVPVAMESISKSVFILLVLLGVLDDLDLLAKMNPLFIGGLILISLVLLVFIYFNLKRRTYEMYSEVITYSKEFLTKEYSLIPIENLSDAAVKQSFLNKLLGYYDATISCQGAGQEIKFKNISNGELLEENIDKLITQTESLVGKSQSKDESELEKEEPSRDVGADLKSETDFTGKYKMNMTRTLFTTFFLIPLFPIWIPIVIFRAIKARFTTYRIKKKSVAERYNFLTQKSVEFNNDKITGVVFKENLIDKLFNTYSILFWSIGSSNNIEFKNIKKDSELSEAIFEKIGIDNSEKIYQSNSTFGLLEAMKANIYWLSALSLITIGVLIAANYSILLYYLIGVSVVMASLLVYKTFYYNRSKLRLYNHYAHFRKGIFFEKYYYVLYEDIKDIETIRYPFSQLGSIKFNVAGEEIKRRGQQNAITSHHFKINYIPDIKTKDDLIDLIFYKRLSKEEAKEVEEKIEDYKPETKVTAYPDLGNSVVKALIFPLAIPFVIWWVKRKSYLIQDYRVVYRRGILFRTQTSIVFNKIDHIDYKQGALNKLFTNGDVLVNTVGTSKTELELKDISDFEEFYDLLESEYRSNR